MSKRETKRAFLINATAEIEGVTPRSVNRVMNDEQNNESVFETFLFLKEEINNAIEKVKLVKEIERLLPFEKAKQDCK